MMKFNLLFEKKAKIKKHYKDIHNPYKFYRDT
jgi:hypothetical protein